MSVFAISVSPMGDRALSVRALSVRAVGVFAMSVRAVSVRAVRVLSVRALSVRAVSFRELREKICNEYVATKMRERKEVGWDEVPAGTVKHTARAEADGPGGRSSLRLTARADSLTVKSSHWLHD